MLAITASILETLIIKTSVSAAQLVGNLIYLGGSSVYSWYYPTLTETEKLQLELKLLKSQVNILQEEHLKNIEKQIIVFDDIDDISLNTQNDDYVKQNSLNT